MSKLITLYRKTPTAANRAKLQSYLDRHMMAVCMASAEETEFLKSNQFTI